MLSFTLQFCYYFCGITLSVFAFGDPKTPILQVVDKGINVDIINALITSITSIVLAVVPLIIRLIAKHRYKVKDDD